MTPYEALYHRNCRSPLCWYETGERKLIGPTVVKETTEATQIIRDRLRTVQSRQKSYEDRRRRDLDFAVGDKVFLKLSPTKGIMRFGKQGKLSPRIIGPFEIIKQIGEVAYRLALLPQLSNMHNMLHV